MKGFFKEGEKLSMGRLLAFVTTLTGLTIAVITAVKGNANPSIVTVTLGLVGTGLGSKVLQKLKEKK